MRDIQVGGQFEDDENMFSITYQSEASGIRLSPHVDIEQQMSKERIFSR